MFVITLLMPSVAGAQYLFDVGLRVPDALSDENGSGSYVDGRYERWYTTALGETAALALIGSSFRSPPVSVWLDSGSDLTGLILGYRMEVRYWQSGSPLPVGARCSTELGNCVRVAVTRATS